MIEWQHGGSTSIDNLVMLCSAHHDQIHDTEWRIDMSTGIPGFIAPDWLETLRRGMRHADPPLLGEAR